MKNDGQSLVEVLIAIAILGVALVGVVAGSTVGVKAIRVSRERVFARQLVDRKIEEVRTEKEADPEGFFATTPISETETDITPPTYTITTTYLQVADRMQVDVVVTWVDGGNTYSVNQSTYLSNR